MTTANNDLFLRYIWEISFNSFYCDCESTIASEKSNKKWYPYAKGGTFRKWYGNLDYCVNWQHNGAAIRTYSDDNGRIRSHNYNLEYIFKRGITWNTLSSNDTSFRSEIYSIFDDKGSSLFLFNNENKNYFYLLGFLNSKLVKTIIPIINPTISYQPGTIASLPYIFKENSYICNIVERAINISNSDWDTHETSWDFKQSPLLVIQQEMKGRGTLGDYLLQNLVNTFIKKWEGNFMQLHHNEEELNRQFIEIYGLQDELTPDVPLDEITILQQGEITIENNQLKWNADVVMKQLISYAIGCMMGRYSIDKPGLILANQGDGLEQYKALVPHSRFKVDDDGIVPLMPADCDFTDNASVRFKQWLSVTFGPDTLVENLNFIEKSLGKSIDDYVVKDFWKDHKKMYQNRPIYWLFSSKKGAFQCIAYMHRMNAYTAERIRTKYLLPHIEWLMQKQSEMEANAANLTTQERRQLDNIVKQIEECREYHDRLHVIADQQIAFDLDDGAVVNYAKFGDVLAKIK